MLAYNNYTNTSFEQLLQQVGQVKQTPVTEPVLLEEHYLP